MIGSNFRCYAVLDTNIFFFKVCFKRHKDWLNAYKDLREEKYQLSNKKKKKKTTNEIQSRHMLDSDKKVAKDIKSTSLSVLIDFKSKKTAIE